MFPGLLTLALFIQSDRVPASPSRVLARASVQAARAALQGDSVAAARARWESALVRDSADRGALLSLATLSRLTRDSAAAERYTARLLRSPADAFSVHARLGRAESQRTGRSLDSAVVEFGLALTEAGRMGIAPAVVESMIGLALVVSRLEPMDSSLAILARAGKLLPPGDLALESEWRCIQAPLLVMAGREGGKQAAMAGLALARRLRDARLQGLCWHAVGYWTYINVDDPAASAPPIDSAESWWRKSGDQAGLAESVVLSGADHLSFFDNARARTDLDQAIEVAVRAGNRIAEAEAKRLLGALAVRTGAFPAAARWLHDANRLAAGLGDRAAIMRIGLSRGNVAHGLGRVGEAERIWQETLLAAERVGDPVTVMGLRHSLSWIVGGRGDWASARRQLDSNFAYMRRHGLAGLIPGLRYTEAVFALRTGDIERAERILRDYIAGSRPTEFVGRYQSRARLAEIHLRRGEVDRSIAELAFASDHLDSLRATLAGDQLRTLAFQTSGGKLEEPDYGFARLIASYVVAGRVQPAFRLAERRRARDLADRMLRAGGSAGPSRVDDDAAGLRAPDDSTALLEFVSGRWNQPSTVFVLAGERLSAQVLPSMDSIGPRVERFLALLQTGDAATRLAARLRADLLDSVLLRLPPRIRRLIIVPDEVLHRLPFDALAFEDGRPLLTRFAISVAPSVQVAAALHAREGGPLPAAILAFGDPSFLGSGENSVAAAEYREAFEESGGLGRLPSARTEAKVVGRHARGATVRLGREATEAFLKRAPLRGVGVIHFATHALVDDWTADRTALALAPGEGEDGFLSPGEILGLDLPPSLVVLSACRTAGGPVVSGEGVQGLTAPLLAAGTRTVVATYWPVRDRSTVPMVRSFYRHLAAGHPVSEALREAKLEAIGRGAPVSEWAAFATVGDPLLRLELELPASPMRRLGYLGGLTAAGLAATLWGIRLYRRRWTTAA